MPSRLYLHLPPGSLATPDLASLVVAWRREDGSSGRGTFADVLPEPADNSGLQLILSAADVHLSRVTLTRQQHRHLKQILPFLLEEFLLNSSDELLFAAGSRQADQLTVAAVAAKPLEALVLFLHRGGWRVETVAVDADLLASHAPLLATIADEHLLVDAEQHALVLDRAGMELCLSQQEVQFAEPDGETLWQWLLEAMATQGHVELMQPGWRPAGRSRSGGRSGYLLDFWRPALILAASLLGVVWIAAAVQTWRYTAAESRWQQASAQLFQELFPEDRATARLRAQLQNHLSQLQRGRNGADFLTLMGKAGAPLAEARKQGVEPQRIAYDQRNGQLLLDINAPSYPVLQTLRSQLADTRLNTEVLVAKTQDKGVSARLKVEKG